MNTPQENLPMPSGNSPEPKQSVSISRQPPSDSDGQGGSEVSSAEQPTVLLNPLIDIYETEEGLVLFADLPGVTAEGLDLQVQDNRLTLFGRTSRTDPDEGRLVHQEYRCGDFLRSFILSDEVDHDRISAHLTNGVLRLDLPRAARTAPRKIQVTTEKDDQPKD